MSRFLGGVLRPSEERVSPSSAGPDQRPQPPVAEAHYRLPSNSGIVSGLPEDGSGGRGSFSDPQYAEYARVGV